VLAEVFRNHGFDGLIYGSTLGPGKNVAIFDLRDAELVNCTLHHVNGVKFEFSQADNTYYMAKHYPEIQKSLLANSPAEEKAPEAVQVFQEPVADTEGDTGVTQ
jgi:hypothetical protein